MDYVISMPDTRKKKHVVHVNLLKKFISRDEVPVGPSVDSVDDAEPLLGNLVTPVVDNHVVSSASVFDVSLSHLETDQQEQLRQLLVRYADVFSDVPGKTDLVQHAFRLTDTGTGSSDTLSAKS